MPQCLTEMPERLQYLNKFKKYLSVYQMAYPWVTTQSADERRFDRSLKLRNIVVTSPFHCQLTTCILSVLVTGADVYILYSVHV
jgi:hypothetical protein